MKVVIIKYNAGNIRSVLLACERIGVDAVVTDDAAAIRQADKVIFPGVGEASTAMQYLRERALDKLIQSLTQPVLGVCLGMQLLCNDSEENNAQCLGIVPLKVKKFVDVDLKIPQIGWNNISELRSPLFTNIADNTHMYFVHGYYVPTSEHTIATANYSLTFAAAVQHKNFYGAQFHPEKSSLAGQQLLQNFIDL
jgi:imidazole glycerol-phosphate synthase subunit HisH